MPEKARVFVAEDDPHWQENIQKILDYSGHRVVLKATTLEQALNAIDRFGELDVQVAVIDGNLNPNISSGEDGRQLVEAIRSQAPTVKIIGMSGLMVKGVDINVGKTGILGLGKTVTRL